jgi:hypothetical protein
MARSQAQENRHTLSPSLYDTLGPRELMPYRELATPADVQVAGQSVERLRIEATERASHRSAEDAKHREHYRGNKTADAEESGPVTLEQI